MPEEENPTVNTAKYDPNILPDMLPVYYKRLFPHKPFYRWLSYGLCKSKLCYHHNFMNDYNLRKLIETL